jgi:hypothetical protein
MMKYNQGVFTSKEQLINTYEEGETLISGIIFTLPPPSSPKT